MLEKIKTLISSIRFWIITTGAISAYLAQLSMNGFSAADLLQTISIYLGVVAGVGTIDKVSDSMKQQ